MPVYGWFTEGFDTADSERGKALLDELTGRRLPLIYCITKPWQIAIPSSGSAAVQIRILPRPYLIDHFPTPEHHLAR